MNAAGFCRFIAPGSAAAVRKTVRGILINADTGAPPAISATVEAH